MKKTPVRSKSVISESVIGESVGQVSGYARRFQELEIYKKARRLAREAFHASKTFPREEAFSLTY